MAGNFFHKKLIVSIVICSFALVLLCSCGSGEEKLALSTDDNDKTEEVTSNKEHAEIAENSGGEGQESTETEESAQIEKDENPPKDIFLKDVTWEDFEDGTETVLHFSFSNGTVADKKLPYTSVVQNIAYQDITEDGVDEVIVYREFVNNIHDDYMLMDFFKIEGDMVIEISPSTDIPELADTAWDTKVVNSSEKEYSISLTMESYGKTAGVMYLDTITTVGYDNGGWKVLEQQKIPDWKLAYLDYLALNTEAAMSDDWLFWLAYVDEDEIPELFFHTNGAQFIVSLITYKNGEVKELGDFGGQGAALWYQEKQGNLLCFGAMMGNTDRLVYHFREGELEEGLYAYTNIPPNMDLSLAEWYWGEEKISEEEYEKRSEAAIGQMTNRIEYENGMHFNELQDILGNVE